MLEPRRRLDEGESPAPSGAGRQNFLAAIRMRQEIHACGFSSLRRHQVCEYTGRRARLQGDNAPFEDAVHLKFVVAGCVAENEVDVGGRSLVLFGDLHFLDEPLHKHRTWVLSAQHEHTTHKHRMARTQNSRLVSAVPLPPSMPLWL